MSTKAVQAVKVCKTFGDNIACNDINLTIETGEFFSLLGPSGCGKTTLLRMIAGFERPTSGTLLIADQDMSNMPPHKRPVNMVFQNYALFPHMTVAENIAFGLQCKGGFSKEETRTKVGEALDLVRLKHLAGRFPSQLSGGQQQRIALARAIINRPKVLLLDEPLSALDPQIREEMQSELSRLQRELQLTFVMVTHDQGEALALSHRIAVFSRGNLEQVGTPTKIYEEPATLFVAEFIGQTNLLKGTALSCDAEWLQADMTNGVTLFASRRLNMYKEPVTGSVITLSVKPHAIKVVPAQSPLPSELAEVGRNDRLNALDATVTSVNYQGFLTEYILQTAAGAILRATRVNSQGSGASVTAIASSEHNVSSPGDKVTCYMLASDCSFFYENARDLVEATV